MSHLYLITQEKISKVLSYDGRVDLQTVEYANFFG